MEINPIRGLRVKQLCEEQGINQIELSQRIYISQQKISEMINGKANVTETTARAIVQAFPQYRFEWLMGYDDYKNTAEKNNAIIRQAQHEGTLLEAGLRFISSLSGFEISGPFERIPQLVPVEELLTQFNEGFIVTKEGESCRLTIDEMVQLENDVCDYVEYRLTRWMKKGR